MHTIANEQAFAPVSLMRVFQGGFAAALLDFGSFEGSYHD
jgi:hypothetical protein